MNPRQDFAIAENINTNLIQNYDEFLEKIRNGGVYLKRGTLPDVVIDKDHLNYLRGSVYDLYCEWVREGKKRQLEYYGKFTSSCTTIEEVTKEELLAAYSDIRTWADDEPTGKDKLYFRFEIWSLCFEFVIDILCQELDDEQVEHICQEELLIDTERELTQFFEEFCYRIETAEAWDLCGDK